MAQIDQSLMYLEGQQGAEIVYKIRQNSRAQSLIPSVFDMWQYVPQLDDNGQGKVRDWFSTALWAHDACRQNMAITMVAPWEWWAQRSDATPTDVLLDMHNLVPAHLDAYYAKHEHIPDPGPLVEAVFKNDVTEIGAGYLPYNHTTKVAMFVPPKGREGDIARIIMYMVAMYPCQLRPLAATTMIRDGDRYPFFTDYAMGNLMAWHRADPVDEAERQRNRVVYHFQGNLNPFVEIADLAEYVWGEKTDQPYVPPMPDEPVDPEQPHQAQPLKGTYSIALDRYIDFYSPFIPNGAIWIIDGKPAVGSSQKLTDLGVGNHTIAFSTPSIKGRVMFKITE